MRGRKGRVPKLLLLSTVAPPLPEEPNDFSESGTDVAITEPTQRYIYEGKL